MCFDRNINGNRDVKFLEFDYLLVQQCEKLTLVVIEGPLKKKVLLLFLLKSEGWGTIVPLAPTALMLISERHLKAWQSDWPGFHHFYQATLSRYLCSIKKKHIFQRQYLSQGYYTLIFMVFSSPGIQHQLPLEQKALNSIF